MSDGIDRLLLRVLCVQALLAVTALALLVGASMTNMLLQTGSAPLATIGLILFVGEPLAAFGIALIDLVRPASAFYRRAIAWWPAGSADASSAARLPYRAAAVVILIVAGQNGVGLVAATGRTVSTASTMVVRTLNGQS